MGVDFSEEAEDAKMLEDLGDAAIESLNDAYQEDLESFETYVHTLRCHVKNSLPDFRIRFLQGYNTLLEEIKKKTEK